MYTRRYHRAKQEGAVMGVTAKGRGLESQNLGKKKSGHVQNADPVRCGEGVGKFKYRACL